MAVIAIGLQAQERTVNSSKTTLKTGKTYLKYVGVAADTLVETNQDSILYVFNNYNHEAIEKIAFVASFDSIAGNDSLYYTLTGYNDLLGTGTTITSGGILVNQLAEIVDIGQYYSTVSDTASGTPMDLSFRHYGLLIIQDDNNDYDGGASLNWISQKLHLK